MEKQFAEEFRRVVNESGKSLYQLERATGLNKSYISKIQRGERLPVSEATVTELLSALSCSTGKSQQLLQLYRIEQLGRIKKDGCEDGLCAVRRLLCTRPPFGDRIYEGSIELPGRGVIHGMEPVIARLYDMFRQEEAAADSTVCIWGAEKYDYLMDAIASYRSRKRLLIRHLACLQADLEKGTENCDRLRRMMAVIVSHGSYVPYIDYTSVMDPEENMAGFTALIITDSKILCFVNETCAFCMEDSEQAAFWRLRFRRCCETARPLLSDSKLRWKREEPVHILGDAAFADPLLGKGNVKAYFSLNTLQAYLYSGVCRENSFFCCKRRSLAERRQLLAQLQEKKEKDTDSMQLLQAERLPLVSWLHVRYSKDCCMLGIKRADGSFVWLQITEKSVLELFSVFFAMLDKRVYCYSDGMQSALLDRLMVLMEKYGKCPDTELSSDCKSRCCQI